MIKRIAEQVLSNILQSNKAVIILGARQVGKTTLIQRALPAADTAYLNLDIEVDKARLIALSSLPPQQAVDALTFGKSILVIDEAQRWEGVGRLVKGWVDSRIAVQVILLGSSSLDLLDKSAESLTGRNEKIYLSPLLFGEVLTYQSWYLPTLTPRELHTHFAMQVRALVHEHLVFGLYPEAVTTSRKRAYLLNLAHDYVLKDVFQAGLTRSPETLRKLLHLLAYQIGKEVSLSELAANLGIARATVERYLQLLEDSFVIFRLSAYSRNLRNEIAKSVKYYFWDVGIRNALVNQFDTDPRRADSGALWENFVVAEFAKTNALAGWTRNLYFWRTTDQSEVDLVVQEDADVIGYEMKLNPPRDRRIRARSFRESYRTTVEVIHSENFLEYIPGFAHPASQVSTHGR